MHKRMLPGLRLVRQRNSKVTGRDAAVLVVLVNGEEVVWDGGVGAYAYGGAVVCGRGEECPIEGSE